MIRIEAVMFVEIKSRLKKVKLIESAYSYASKCCYQILQRISLPLACKYIYKQTTGKALNLNNPRDFNEKLQWLNIYWKHPLVVKCADKYEVRKYVEDCGCEAILNELYCVYDDAKKICWDDLPKKVAVKCTHGCGFNIICTDTDSLDKTQAVNMLNGWLKTKYGRFAGESHYDKMKPRIVCEKYIETKDGVFPNDYKIYCFNGKPKLLLVCCDRDSDIKLYFMDLEWKLLDIGVNQNTEIKLPTRPVCLDLMIEYAAKLAVPFPFVRIDFYDCNGTPILGEMTFTPAGCRAKYYSEYGLKFLGDMLQLPEKYDGHWT